jgi:predicted transcriptional regulator
MNLFEIIAPTAYHVYLERLDEMKQNELAKLDEQPDADVHNMEITINLWKRFKLALYSLVNEKRDAFAHVVVVPTPHELGAQINELNHHDAVAFLEELNFDPRNYSEEQLDCLQNSSKNKPERVETGLIERIDQKETVIAAQKARIEETLAAMRTARNETNDDYLFQVRAGDPQYAEKKVIRDEAFKIKQRADLAYGKGVITEKEKHQQYLLADSKMKKGFFELLPKNFKDLVSTHAENVLRLLGQVSITEKRALPGSVTETYREIVSRIKSHEAKQQQLTTKVVHLHEDIHEITDHVKDLLETYYADNQDPQFADKFDPFVAKLHLLGILDDRNQIKTAVLRTKLIEVFHEVPLAFANHPDYRGAVLADRIHATQGMAMEINYLNGKKQALQIEIDDMRKDLRTLEESEASITKPREIWPFIFLQTSNLTSHAPLSVVRDLDRASELFSDTRDIDHDIANPDSIITKDEEIRRARLLANTAAANANIAAVQDLDVPDRPEEVPEVAPVQREPLSLETRSLLERPQSVGEEITHTKKGPKLYRVEAADVPPAAPDVPKARDLYAEIQDPDQRQLAFLSRQLFEARRIPLALTAPMQAGEPGADEYNAFTDHRNQLQANEFARAYSQYEGVNLADAASQRTLAHLAHDYEDAQASWKAHLTIMEESGKRGRNPYVSFAGPGSMLPEGSLIEPNKIIPPTFLLLDTFIKKARLEAFLLQAYQLTPSAHGKLIHKMADAFEKQITMDVADANEIVNLISFHDALDNYNAIAKRGEKNDNPLQLAVAATHLRSIEHIEQTYGPINKVNSQRVNNSMLAFVESYEDQDDVLSGEIEAVCKAYATNLFALNDGHLSDEAREQLTADQFRLRYELASLSIKQYDNDLIYSAFIPRLIANGQGPELVRRELLLDDDPALEQYSPKPKELPVTLGMPVLKPTGISLT